MSKEYLGVNAVNDLFDIIDENYVSKEDLENREKNIASAICVGSALIAENLLKLIAAIIIAKGGEGGEDVSNPLIASASEVNELLNRYFSGGSTDTSTQDKEIIIDESTIATDEEAGEVLDNYFN